MRIVERWYTGERIVAGSFRCLPGDVSWDEPNNVGEGAHVVFPRTTVLIEQDGRRPIVTTPNEAVLYDEGRGYRRGLVDESGDDCTWIQIAPSLLTEMSAGTRPRVFDPEGTTFTTEQVPIATSLYLAQMKLFAALRKRDPDDPLAIEEALLQLVEAALANGPNVEPPGSRPATRRAHHDLVEEAKKVLAGSFRETPALEAIARSLHVSPFFLARTFRGVTGSTMHRYRLELRLRRALVLLAETRLPVADVAAAVGFTTHSHFTSWFTRVHGAPPSRFAADNRWRATAG